MKLSQHLLHSAVALAIAGTASGVSQAATVTGWNPGNVETTTNSDGSGQSVIYNSNSTANATSNGKVIFDGDEAFSPGLTVETNAFSAGGSSFSGCIGANSSAAGGQVGSSGCGGDFQSGKRFKNVLTGDGPLDFVFDTEASDLSDPYRVFHRLINDTGEDLVDLIVTLGTGVGGDFQQSVEGDNLRFSASTEFGQADLPATSQFPFGLFGDASTNDNFDLDGFFAPARSGLVIPDFSAAGETDQFSMSEIFGPYSDIFGAWMTLGEVPGGAFWDFDDNPDTDDLLMAWFDGSVWEQRRDVEIIDGELSPFSLTGTDVKSAASLGDLSFGAPITLGEGIIEDLANLNLNYAIDLAGYRESSFTLRVESFNAVPTPATMALLGLGLAGLGYSRRKKT